MATASSMDLPEEVNLLKDVINPWLLGADPEFAILTPPDVVVPNNGPNAVNTTKAAGQIGSDHNGRVWELRPAPSKSAYVVAANIWKLLRQQEMDKLEQFKWKGGALGGRKNAPAHFTYAPNTGVPAPTTLQGWLQLYNSGVYGLMTEQQAMLNAQVAFQNQQAQLQAQQSPNNFDTLGGHVHFGMAGFNPAQRQALNDVTTGLLNLDILPRKENTRRLEITASSHPQYGHMNGGDAVRDCNGHVEYRCAPSWLDRPGQALAALTCYKLGAARPSSVTWPKQQALKGSLMEWLEYLAGADVDAWMLLRYITKFGFELVQADPDSDFKPLWRQEVPW